MKNKKLINILCLSGIISIVFYLLHDLISQSYYPGYNWLSMAVSDLTAKDAPSFVVASGYVSIYRIFNVLCCALVCVLVGKEKNTKLRLGVYIFGIMNLISAVGYAMFPLSSAGFDGTLGSIIHVYVITTLVVLLSIVSLVLITIGAIKSKHNILGFSALIALILMFIGAIGSSVVPKEYFGIVERLSTYSAVIFTGILGVYGFNKK